MNGDDDRIVRFEYCVSLVFVTIWRQSPPVRVPVNGWAWPRGLPFTLISLVCGWWGLPWGLLWTPVTIAVNLWGGRPVESDPPTESVT